jgi:hypothetical protein
VYEYFDEVEEGLKLGGRLLLEVSRTSIAIHHLAQVVILLRKVPITSTLGPNVGGNGDRSLKVVRSTVRTMWLHICFMQYIKEKDLEFWLCIFQPFDGKDAFNNWRRWLYRLPFLLHIAQLIDL